MDRGAISEEGGLFCVYTLWRFTHHQAATNLQTCRHLLKWTYAFAFYLESSSKNNNTKIFEDNQADLEFAVERLSEMLEKPLEREKVRWVTLL